MKKLCFFLTLCLLCSNIALANIFNCEIKSKDLNDNLVAAKIFIEVDNNSSTQIKINNLKNKFYQDSYIKIAEDAYFGKLTIINSTEFLSGGTGEAYNLIVTYNSKKNDTMYFRAFFSENNQKGLVHSLTIKVWEKNMPIYFFLSNKPEIIFKGNCK